MLVAPGFAEGDGKSGVVVRAGDAVVDGSGVHIEGGPSVDGANVRVGDDENGSGEEGKEDQDEGAPVGDGEVVLRLKGDEGVEFSGTCSVGGEEQEFQGRVPEEFGFKLDGDELECEVRKEGEGTLRMVLLSGNSRSVQTVAGDGTVKLSFSGNSVSSSTSSGSSSAVSQSSSSVSQSSSSSTSE